MQDSTQRDGGHPGIALTEKREGGTHRRSRRWPSLRRSRAAQSQTPLLHRDAYQFARLIRLGVSNSEACRRVGINRRTGTR